MTETGAPEERDYGRLERDHERAIVCYTRRLPHPPSRVWRALTEPEHLATWFPTTIDGERAAGARLIFRFADMNLPPMEGEILAFEPPSLLEFRWGPDLLRFELVPDDERTTLVFTATMEEFGKAARDGAGWHTALDLLAYELSGEQPPVTSSERWHEVNGAYAERFGPEASMIGPPEEREQTHGEIDSA
ncbi:MAG TPA: SRPBCC family protein [Solirubrobacteraceae bacterium]|jgi:uncharacterized protein YndB with AHSA1/START domain